MKKNKIWIVSEFFFPEMNSTGYFMTTIAENLAQDNRVSVITASNNQDQKNDIKFNNNIDIHRIKSFNLDKANLVKRTIKLLLLSLQFTYILFFKVKKGDKIFCVTNPTFIILLIPFIKMIKKNINTSVLVYDVFPENLYATGILSKNTFLYKFLNKIYNICYESFDNIIVIGRDMKEIFKKKINLKKHDRLKFITNWAETSLVTPMAKSDNSIIKKLKLENKIVIQFAGNIGRAQGLEQLVSIFSSCDKNKFHFLFIGDGVILNKLKNHVVKNNIENITFLGSLPRSEQNIFLNACDIGLVTLNSNMYGLGVPSKSYNILSAGKPIFCIASSSSEIALMIKENKVGWVIENNEIEKIPKILEEIFNDKKQLKLISKNCRTLVMKSYSKEVILNKYFKLLKF
tara:strand:+ start:192 stop:1397 length:1206 start_codon:yes stop_codon:yes gene_type:complete